jgi:hypothetical protein
MPRSGASPRLLRRNYALVLVTTCDREGYGTDPLFAALANLPYGIGLFVGPQLRPLAAEHRHGDPKRRGSWRVMPSDRWC